MNKMRLYEFIIPSYDLALVRLRNSDAEAGAKTESTWVVPTTEFLSIEMHASEVYTRNF